MSGVKEVFRFTTSETYIIASHLQVKVQVLLEQKYTSTVRPIYVADLCCVQFTNPFTVVAGGVLLFIYLFIYLYCYCVAAQLCLHNINSEGES